MPIASQSNRPSEVIYQIYPSSFADANHDGHGDLKGITQKLDYVKSLGVDAIWISPFFLSPEGAAGDGGYAITDYRKIAPRYGNMRDFEELLSTAHEKGLRVYTDFVVCHTSDQHEWFKKSQARQKGFENRYVWHDGKKDASGHTIQPPQPPTNWKSVFGGPAWTFDDKRQQFYLRHFNSSQPALNLNDPEVQKASLDEMKFWLDKGVDGLRIDALPFANYDPQLRDNPGKFGRPPGDYWASQDFNHSMCQPETEVFVRKIRALMDSYPQSKRKTALGEVVAGPWGGDGSMQQAAKYLNPKDGLHTCYTQSLVQFYNEYPNATRLRDMIRQNIELSPDGGFCNNLGNHDFPRFTTRMMGNAPYELHQRITKQLMTLALALPGSFCMYQGEELGLTQATAHELAGKKQDAVALECRDGCRTPMPWDADAPGAGFSTHPDPYLPVPKSHLPLAVDIQESQSESMLNFTRRVLAQRRDNPALQTGQTLVLGTQDPIVAFVRQSEGQSVLCSFNMSGRKVSFKPAEYLPADIMRTLKIPGDGVVHLEAYASSFHGLNPLKRGVEQGMAPAAASTQEPATVAAPGEPKRVFAADMLIADFHVPEASVAKTLAAYKKEHDDFADGDKETLSKAQYQRFLAEASATKTTLEMTPGGATMTSLWMLKQMMGDGVQIELMGLAGDGAPGQMVHSYLTQAGINLPMQKWPEGRTPETAKSLIIKHKGQGHKSTVLTYPGNGIEAMHELLARPENANLLDDCIAKSDMVYLPESTMSKFGVPFTNKLLELRWKHKKELVLSLPTRADFGPDDSKRFRDLIPSCNVVMGNDVEFCRILDKEAKRPVSEAQMDRVIAALQAEFKKDVLSEYKMPCSKHGQVAFITRGNDAPALLVTKDDVEEIQLPRVKKVDTMLGAGHATFAGFLTGYLKGLTHEQSATLAMALASEKVQQKSSHPYLTDPEKSLGRCLLRGGPMRAIARSFEHDVIEEPVHKRISRTGMGGLPDR